MWSISKGILWLLDGFFDILNKIWRYEFFENEYVNKIYGCAIIVACSWLILKVVVELVMNHIIKNDGNNNPLSIYRGIILAIVMMFLINPLFQFGHNISTEMTNAVISLSELDNGTNAESSISKSLISSMIYYDETKEENVDYLVENWKTIDINETEDGVLGMGDVYKYSLNFFMLILLTLITIFLLFYVAIQMAKRVMEIALYKIIGPFCCTSLTNEQSRAFSVWLKSSMGVFLITVVQFVCIGLLLTMFGSSFADNGLLTGIFLIIGALLFIISTPAIINALLDQQSGVTSALGDIQSIITMGHITKSIMKVPASGVMAAVAGTSYVMNNHRGGFGGGMNIKNMFSNNNFTNEQMNALKQNLENGNVHKAYTQSKDFASKNLGKDIPKMSNINPVVQPFSMQYNPIRNQYFSNNNNTFNWRKEK